MKFKFNSSELTAENKRWISVGRQAVDNIWAMLREVSFLAERQVKSQMPVDTGRARASWGHWTPGDIRGNSDANVGDAWWKEQKESLTTEQGSNVDYVQGLNEGHSAQAGAGFIDRVEEEMARELEKEVDDIIKFWGS